MTIDRCVQLLEQHYVVTNNRLHRATSGDQINLNEINFYELELQLWSQTIAFLNDYKHVMEVQNDKL